MILIFSSRHGWKRPGPAFKFCIMLACKGKVKVNCDALKLESSPGWNKEGPRLLVTCLSPIINGVQWGVEDA